MFTGARIDNAPKVGVSILAPLAVVPRFQKQGVGGELIKTGLKLLSEARFDVVFVLGHLEYYPRFGFAPAGKLGFKAPYPIPERDAGAWMAREVHKDVIGSVRGKVACCDALMKPEYWRE